MRAGGNNRGGEGILDGMALRLCLCLATAAVAVGASDWAYYGADAGGSRYSSLSEINCGNVARLEVAWTYRTGALDPETRLNRKAAFEATPILVDGTLYLSTPFNHVIALDAVTGVERWKFDPNVDRSKNYSEVTSRGVSAWLDTRAAPAAPCRRRIFTGTLDGRLIALDAKAGRPCAGFGDGGTVDLTRDIRLRNRGDYQVTSPPAIINDLVVVGSSIGDNRAVELERGTVRAFDARTGALRWSWDPIPTDPADAASKTWEGNSAQRTGGANAWSVIATDPERGLVFVPTGSASPDFYGGERRGSNLYANSLVALRASDGKIAWHFQVVHHDIWDYDVASPPALVTLKRNGRNVPAVLAGTKMGHLFVLDRATGKPLFDVEERPVPRSNVPGEAAWPTQPFPVLPRPLVPQKVTPEDAWGLTAADRDWCRERIRASRSEGIFTPPSVEGSILFPGNVGGMNWSGMAVDAKRGWAVINTNRLATFVRLIPREEVKALREREGDRMRGEFGPQSGTPYFMYRESLRAPGAAPCNAPPWGALAAVDLNSGVLKWEVPLGAMPFLTKVPESEKWGSVNLGGPIVTAGGLVFIGAAMDNYFRAFDIETGNEVWKAELPASAQATPMTYRAGGRQFVVISSGGHGNLGTKMGDSVVAFAVKR